MLSTQFSMESIKILDRVLPRGGGSGGKDSTPLPALRLLPGLLWEASLQAVHGCLPLGCHSRQGCEENCMFYSQTIYIVCYVCKWVCDPCLFIYLLLTSLLTQQTILYIFKDTLV